MTLIPRVIPVFLLKDSLLYKGKSFKRHKYVGDPINTIKIFNDKEVDEIILLDINTSIKQKKIDFELLEKIASEAFIPMAYGGGIHCLEDAKVIFEIGFEKIVIGTAAITNPELLEELTEHFGSQSIVVSMDVKKNFFGKYKLMSFCGTKMSSYTIESFLENIRKSEVGELFLNAIDRDGSKKGYDLELIKKVSSALDIPVISGSGAWSLNHLKEGLMYGASAVAAGSMFVYHGPHNAVMMNYPSRDVLEILFKELV